MHFSLIALKLFPLLHRLTETLDQWICSRLPILVLAICNHIDRDMAIDPFHLGVISYIKWAVKVKVHLLEYCEVQTCIYIDGCLYYCEIDLEIISTIIKTRLTICATVGHN